MKILIINPNSDSNTDRIMAEKAKKLALPEVEVPAELARANEAFAERVRVETDALLGKVLYTTSCAMKNSFAMNDNVR